MAQRPGLVLISWLIASHRQTKKVDFWRNEIPPGTSEETGTGYWSEHRHRSLPNTAGDLPRLSQKLIIRESWWFSTK